MKLKNVKKGVRVRLKEDYSILTKGMTGTILTGGRECPIISWDFWNNGFRLKGTTYSCWDVPILYLKLIKEEDAK